MSEKNIGSAAELSEAEVSRRILLRGIAGLVGAAALARLALPGRDNQYWPGSYENLLRADGQDPWVFEFEDEYYLSMVDKSGDTIQTAKARELDGLKKADFKTIWSCEGTGLEKPWAPEVHYIEEESVWALYFSAVPRKLEGDAKNESRRMYVARGTDPEGPFSLVGSLEPETSRYAIDGTLWRPWGGETFFMYSGPEESYKVSQNLYITRMKSPWELQGERLLIARPMFPGEMHTNGKVPGGIVEGPQQLRVGNREYIPHARSATFTNLYQEGIMEYVGSGDPFNEGIEAFLRRRQAVLEGANGIYSPGHASFLLKSGAPTGKVIYHNAKHWGAGTNRELRSQDFLVLPGDELYFAPPL